MSTKTQSTSRSGGIGFAGLLTILFIGLKLTNHIDWSWLWVLSPLWLPLAVLLAFAGACFAVAAIMAAVVAVLDR